eukprot:8803-Heterococcus_DN1.PRE.2
MQLMRSVQSNTEKLERHSQKTEQQLAHILQAISADKTDSTVSMLITESQHRHQRARVNTDDIPVLERPEVLDTVFSFVGIGEYYYVAGVCRNWRGRYLTLCHNTRHKYTNTVCPPYTSCDSIVTTADRLQLALDNGLTIDKLDANQALYIVTRSLEPMQVITLARLYGMQWNVSLTGYAAYYGKYELLQWLHRCNCPWDLDSIIDGVVDYSFDNLELEHIKQLYAISGPWPGRRLLDVLQWAACFNALDTFNKKDTPAVSQCWPLQCVQWVLANGSTWLVWRCQDLAPQHYECCTDGAEHGEDTCDLDCHRKNAIQLFAWAHENGCPCTCGEAAAAAAAV